MKNLIGKIMLITSLPLFSQSAEELEKESNRYLAHSTALGTIIINSKTKPDQDAIDLQKLISGDKSLLRALANHRKDVSNEYSAALLNTFITIHEHLLISIKMLDLRINVSNGSPETVREMVAILATYKRTQALIKPAIEEAERLGLYKPQ